MKFFTYLKYFFYLGFNWNFRLAFFMLKHEIEGEKKYGIQTTSPNNLKKLSVRGNNLAHAEIYQGVNYFLLENLFEYLQSIGANKSIVDFGCGKGRVLAAAASYGFSKITGIEFAKELCEIAKKNIIPVQLQFPDKIFNVIHADALEYIVEDDTDVCFFFNPFDEVIMLASVKNILHSLKENPREIYVVYVNPLYKEIFLSARFEQVYNIEKLHYVNATIFKRSMEDTDL